MHILTDNISKMVKDRADIRRNITNAISYEAAYGLSLRLFKSDLGPF